MDTVVVIASYLCVLFVVLPIVKSDFWIFRVLEYSRFQNFLLCTFIVCFLIINWQYSGQLLVLPFCLNIICWIYLLIKILPYTLFWKKEVRKVVIRQAAKELKLLNANVLQHNKAFSRLLKQIDNCKPDLILLLETDVQWQSAMAPLKKEYPHTIEVPQDNTYGMLFYSKYPLEDAQINFLVKQDIPSISCKVKLKDGDKIQLWGLHPEPPVPGESLTSTAKDKELSIVALKAKDCNLPVIVMGDLNDVAWSYTTSLFTKTSGLLDVRKGRGFYSTFSAHHWFVRFPLDYIFCSPDFGFITMKRLQKNGSDHFPIFTHLILDPSLKQKQKKEQPNKTVLKEAAEKATEEI